MAIQICTRCEGYGNVEFNVGSHNSKYETEECGLCYGSGRLEVETQITERPFCPGENKACRIH